MMELLPDLPGTITGISHANTYLGYAFVNDGFTHNSCAAPGEDEGGGAGVLGVCAYANGCC